MPPPDRVGPRHTRQASHVETPYPPVVPRGGSAERIHAQIRTRLTALAARPLESTFNLPGGERATALTTLTVTDTNPPQVRATVVVTVSENVRREQRGEYQGQVRQNTAGMVRRALTEERLAAGYLAQVDVRWATRR